MCHQVRDLPPWCPQASRIHLGWELGHSIWASWTTVCKSASWSLGSNKGLVQNCLQQYWAILFHNPKPGTTLLLWSSAKAVVKKVKHHQCVTFGQSEFHLFDSPSFLADATVPVAAGSTKSYWSSRSTIKRPGINTTAWGDPKESY